MDTEIIKKIINNKFDKIEDKVNTLNDTLSEKTTPLNNELPHAYIAGFFDGEGTIGVYKDKRNNNISLKSEIMNTNLEILKRIKSVFKGEIYIRKKQEKQPEHKQQWVGTLEIDMK